MDERGIASTVLLCRVQRVVNATNGDPDGTINAHFGFANVLVLLFGGLVWLLLLATAVFPDWPGEPVDGEVYVPLEEEAGSWE